MFYNWILFTEEEEKETGTNEETVDKIKTENPEPTEEANKKKLENGTDAANVSGKFLI